MSEWFPPHPLNFFCTYVYIRHGSPFPHFLFRWLKPYETPHHKVRLSSFVIPVWWKYDLVGEGGATCRCLLTAARLDNSCATYILLVTLLSPKWAFSQGYGRNGLAPHRGRVVWPREQPCHLPPRWLEWVLTMTEHQAPWHPGPRDKLIRDERWDTQVLALPELIGLPPERTSTR